MSSKYVAGLPVVRLAPEGIRFDGYVEADPNTVSLATQWLEGNEVDNLVPWASTALALGSQVIALGDASGGLAGLTSIVSRLAGQAERASADLARDVGAASTRAAETVEAVTRKASEEAARAITLARQQAAADLAAGGKGDSGGRPG